MASNLPEKALEPIILEDNFNLAFKLVFFDENNKEVEPAQYKALSTFGIEEDASIK